MAKKVENIVNKNTEIRNDILQKNRGKYRYYGANLDPVVGSKYDVYENENNSKNTEQHADILRYTHGEDSQFAQSLRKQYGRDSEKLAVYVNRNVKPSYTVNEYDGLGDYISYVNEVYGKEESYAGHLAGLMKVRDMAEDLAYDVFPDMENKTFSDYINEILQYSDVKYAMERDSVGIVRNIDVAKAVLGVVTTNINNYSGKETRMGMISNRMYGRTLLDAAYFNSLRRTKYITPDTERVYGNNLANVYSLSSMFTINPETGRIADPDSGIYIQYFEEPTITEYLQGMFPDFTMPENAKVDTSVNEERYDKQYKSSTKYETTASNGYGLSDSFSYFVYSEGDIESNDNPYNDFESIDVAASVKQVSVVDDIDYTRPSLLQKTNEFLKTRKINTMISRFHDSDNKKGGITQSSYSPTFGVSHGRNLLTKQAWEDGTADNVNGYSNPYCRVWTNHHQYSKVKHLIRPFTDEGDVINAGDLQKDWSEFRTEDGAARLNEHGVLNKNGFVNITPVDGGSSSGDEVDIKNCMFSIENLAWRDVLVSEKGKYRKNGAEGFEYDDEMILSKEQQGPNGGRIMWFPPYDITFQETASASWSKNEFIGRGEPVYTYVNSNRRGTLEFSILVDHPSILNYWMERRRNNANEDDEQTLLRFFAGCDTLDLETQKTENILNNTYTGNTVDPKEVEERNEVIFYTFFPNNYSGIDFEYPKTTESITKIAIGDSAGNLKCTVKGNGIEEKWVYQGYEMGVNSISVDYSYKKNNSGKWGLHAVYGPIEGEKIYNDVEDYGTLIECPSLSEIKALNFAKYDEYIKLVNEGNAEALTKVEEIENWFDKNSKINKRYNKTKPLYFYVAPSADTTDGIVTANTAAEAYAHYQKNTLRRINVEDITIPPKSFLSYKNSEIACRAVSVGNEQLWKIQLIETNNIPWVEFENRKEFNKSSELFGKKVGENVYWVKAYGDTMTYKTPEMAETIAKDCIARNQLIPKFLTVEQFKLSNSSYGEVNGKYYSYGLVKTNDNECYDDILKELSGYTDEDIVEKYYSNHKYGLIDEIEYENNFGLFQYYVEGSPSTVDAYDSVQEFVVGSNVMNSSGQTCTGVVFENENYYEVTGTLTVGKNNKPEYPLDKDKESETLKEINLTDYTSFGLNSTLEAVKKYTGNPNVTYSFGEVFAALNGDKEIKNFVLQCEKHVLEKQLGYTGVELKDKCTEAERRIEYLTNVLNHIDNNSPYKITKITTTGGASSDGYVEKNNELANNRETMLRVFLRSYPILKNVELEHIEGGTATQNLSKNVSDITAKVDRFAYASFIVEKKDVIAAEESETTTTTNLIQDNKIVTKKNKRYDNERLFFEMLKAEDNIAYNNLIDKVKYFSPAFHSITPEGFNARLTFLHQCTRQGPTSTASDIESGSTAANLAFGRAPFCVLRLGDFLNTKIIIDSVNITYPDSMWDLNPEGIGVQFLMAKVSMQIEILGGSDISAPIKRLQNAVSFNYYANTSLYDNRSDTAIYGGNNSIIDTKQWFARTSFEAKS